MKHANRDGRSLAAGSLEWGCAAAQRRPCVGHWRSTELSPTGGAQNGTHWAFPAVYFLIKAVYFLIQARVQRSLGL